MPLHAQHDSLKKKTVEITSAFKPAIKETAKINFTASPAAKDTSIPKLNYSIPNQNLSFNYKSDSIKPLALYINSEGVFSLSNFIKIGYGNFKTPYLQSGFSFGNGFSKGLNIYANHVSSKSKDAFQNFSKSNLDFVGFYKTKNNHEWNAKLGVNIDKYYRNMNPGLGDSVRQQFQSFTSKISYRNLKFSKFGLIYSPELEVNVFKDSHFYNGSEQVFNLRAPFSKNVSKSLVFHLGANFNYANYSQFGVSNSTNILLGVSAFAHFKTPKINLKYGFNSNWDNNTFKVYPNITAEVSTDDKRFVFQAGWVGVVEQQTYQNLVFQNPWIKAPWILKNIWREERYAGFKGSVGNHISYSTKVGFQKYKNHPLFIQNLKYYISWPPLPPLIQHPFTVYYEQELKVLNFNAEFGYTVQEKMSILTTIVYNQYSDLKQYSKPYGLVPLEIKTSFRYQLMNDLWLKSDLFAWSSSYCKTQNWEDAKVSGAVDFNAGVEYSIAKKINLWAQFNNILNKEYQRWNLFPTYGFNFVGGVIFKFDK